MSKFYNSLCADNLNNESICGRSNSDEYDSVRLDSCFAAIDSNAVQIRRVLYCTIFTQLNSILTYSVCEVDFLLPHINFELNLCFYTVSCQ